MDLLTIKVPTTALDEACLSQGGLVDRDTAAADCVVLWTDFAPLGEAPARLTSVRPRRASPRVRGAA